VYACFAVSEGAALRALLGEPRMLGMTPDTALVDLDAEVRGGLEEEERRLRYTYTYLY
jgi:hypothetical protein